MPSIFQKVLLLSAFTPAFKRLVHITFTLFPPKLPLPHIETFPLSACPNLLPPLEHTLAQCPRQLITTLQTVSLPDDVSCNLGLPRPLPLQSLFQLFLPKKKKAGPLTPSFHSSESSSPRSLSRCFYGRSFEGFGLPSKNLHHLSLVRYWALRIASHIKCVDFASI